MPAGILALEDQLTTSSSANQNLGREFWSLFKKIAGLGRPSPNYENLSHNGVRLAVKLQPKSTTPLRMNEPFLRHF